MTHDIPVLDAQGYRRFGLSTGAIFVFLFWGMGPVIKHGLSLAWANLPTWPWVVAAALAVPAVVYPKALGPVHWGWMKLGGILGFINTRIILTAFYFVLLCPAALLMRLTGKVGMRLGYETTKKSYRIVSNLRPPQSMDHPF